MTCRALVLALVVSSGCTGRALVVPGPGDGSRDFSVSEHGDLAGADLAGRDLAGVDLGVGDLAPGPDMQPVPLPSNRGASVGTGLVVLAADLDADGDEDLVVVEAAGTVRIYNGNGKGALFPRQAFEINTSTTLETGVLADVDGDGVLDLVLAENGSKSEVDVLRGNGDATFADWARVQIAGGVVAVAVGDLNGDGAPDLVAATEDHFVHVLAGMKSGKPQLLAAAYGLTGRATQLATVDLDHDGNLDVVEIDEVGTSLITGDGHFAFLMNRTQQTPANAQRFVLGDWSLDGNPDVVAVGHTGATLLIRTFYGDGAGDVAAQSELGDDLSTVSGRAGLASGDLDGDGLADVVVASDGVAAYDIEYASPTGGFTAPPRSVAIDEGATSIALGDFDNDGHLDVAAAGATKTQLYLTQP